MKPSKEFLKRHAEQLLVLARTTADIRMQLTQRAEELYGGDGPWVAGGIQYDWPEEVKETIRRYAIAFGEHISVSLGLWQEAGCKQKTWIHRKESLGVFHY